MKKLIVFLLVLVVLLSACGTKDVTTIYRMTCYQFGNLVIDELVSDYRGTSNLLRVTLYPSGEEATILISGCAFIPVEK